jgi:rare lipoprotein A
LRHRSGRRRCRHRALRRRRSRPRKRFRLRRLEPRRSRRIALISSADAAPRPGSAASAQTALFAQVGAFGDRANASRLVERLRANGFVNAFVVSEEDGRRTLHRVRLGPLRDDQEFDQVRARLRSLGFGESQLVTAR